MSAKLDDELHAELRALAAAGRLRSLDDDLPEAPGRDFTSNDTLSLARHPEVIAAARAAAAEFGAGGRASRLLGGGSPPDRAVERAVAEWLACEEALLFPSGYAANLGLIGALATRGDVLVCDALLHASLVDAARLSGAQRRVVPHGDPDAVAAALRASRGARRRFVLTEGVFSMDGDRAPLAELAALCREHDAALLVDEAHAIGVLGPHGAGAVAQAELPAELLAVVAARVITGGKALGVAGACVAGSRALRELLINRARSLIFTTAVPPAVSGALVAAVRLAREAQAQRRHIAALGTQLAAALGCPAPDAAILPVVLGEERTACAVAARLREQGFAVRAVRPPTVPPGTARLRLALHAHNTGEDIAALAAALHEVAPAARSESPPRAHTAPRAGQVICVVGTDTGVGKTVVSAALTLAALRHAEGPVGYWKPLQTGDECDTTRVAELLGAQAARARIPEPAQRFPLPASPHAAAAAAGTTVDIAVLTARLRALRDEARAGHTWIVEPAGGLLVPLDAHSTQADLLAQLAPAVVLVARSGLGTLNHVLLTVEALAARGLRIAALVLVGPRHASNRETLAARLAPPLLLELPPLEPLDAVALAAWVAAQDWSALFGARAQDAPNAAAASR